MRLETERLIIDAVKEADKEDYFVNISHDKKVLENLRLPIRGDAGGV